MDFNQVKVPQIPIEPLPPPLNDWNLPFQISATPSPSPKPIHSPSQTKRRHSKRYSKYLIHKYSDYQNTATFHTQWILDKEDRESLLGSGAAGAVYKCYKKEFLSNISDEYLTGITFCAKIIDISYIKDPIIRLKIINNIIGEFNLVQTNNLLKYKQLFIEHNTHCKAIIVMQQLKNPLNKIQKCFGYKLNDNLNDYENGILHFQDKQKLFRFATDIGTNILKIHCLGYAHFDIKPENICFDSLCKRWRIIDYGLYRRINGNKVYKRKGLFGSKGFIAPEISIKLGFGISILTQFADVYAFGLILLFVINGGSLYKNHKIWENKQRLEIKQGDDVKFMHSKEGHDELYKFLKYLLLFGVIESALYKVLRVCLEFDYKKRVSMKEVMKMDYFMKGCDGERGE